MHGDWSVDHVIGSLGTCGLCIVIPSTTYVPLLGCYNRQTSETASTVLLPSPTRASPPFFILLYRGTLRTTNRQYHIESSNQLVRACSND